MKAFVTGVGGFVGPYLVEHLVKHGFEVFGIDKRGSKVDGCSVLSCDVTDADALFRIVNRIKPDYVFHLAGQSSVAKSWKEPELTRKINVGGTKNLLDAVVAARISPRILVVSSAEVYGVPKQLPTPETHRIAPISPYGESRVEQERLALGFFRAKKVQTVISRSFNHTGPGQPPGFVCSNFAKQVADVEKGRQPPVISVGDLTVKRDFSDVRDVVRAYLLLLEKGKPGESYNVCSGRTFLIGDVLNKLLKISGLKAEIKKEASRLKEVVVPVLQGDNSKLVAATAWKPVISLDETLSALLDYWRAR